MTYQRSLRMCPIASQRNHGIAMHCAKNGLMNAMGRQIRGMMMLSMFVISYLLYKPYHMFGGRVNATF